MNKTNISKIFREIKPPAKKKKKDTRLFRCDIG